MPIYSYICPDCLTKQDVFKKIADLERVEFCPRCKAGMKRQVAAPMVRGDYEGYTCPVSGKWIEGRRAHEENLARLGCRVLEPGETEQFKRQRASEEASLDKAVESTVEEFVETLPTAKKEQLAVEVQQGADAVVVRN